MNISRAPSFGFGTRIEWVNKNIAPPGLYETATSFRSSRKKGYSFSSSPRQDIFKEQFKDNPGPAKYAIHDDEPKGLAYSIGLIRRTPNHAPLALDPGKYEPI
jgi:hypothetical protein